MVSLLQTEGLTKRFGAVTAVDGLTVEVSPGITGTTAWVMRKAPSRLVAITVRPDLIAPEWRAMLQQPSFAVVVDPLFGEMLHRYFANAGGAGTLIVTSQSASAELTYSLCESRDSRSTGSRSWTP